MTTFEDQLKEFTGNDAPPDSPVIQSKQGRDDFDRVKDGLVGRYEEFYRQHVGDFKPNGTGLKAHGCPACQATGNTDSFNLDPELGLWNCHRDSCKAGGDVFEFVERYGIGGAMNKRTALEHVASWAGVSLPPTRSATLHGPPDDEPPPPGEFAAPTNGRQLERAESLRFKQRLLSGVLDPEAGQVPYLVEQLFPEAAQTVIAAGWKTGKTLAVYYVLLCCVLAERIFGRFNVANPIKTCVLQLEMPGYEDDRRFRRLCIGMGCDPKEIVDAQADGRLHYFNRRDLNLYTHPEHALDLRDYCRENEIRLLIIDNIGALYAGIDLNDASQVRLAHDRAMQPILDAGITVVILHHHSKLGMDPKSDDRVALLGSQAWGAVSARIYTLRRVKEDQLATEADPTEFYLKFALTGTWSPAEFKDVLLRVADTDAGGTEMLEADRKTALVESSTDRTNRVMLYLLNTGKLNLDAAKSYGVSKAQYDRGSTRLRQKGWMLGSTAGQKDDRRITQAGRTELQKSLDLHGEPEKASDK